MDMLIIKSEIVRNFLITSQDIKQFQEKFHKKLINFDLRTAFTSYFNEIIFEMYIKGFTIIFKILKLTFTVVLESI